MCVVVATFFACGALGLAIHCFCERIIDGCIGLFVFRWYWWSRNDLVMFCVMYTCVGIGIGAWLWWVEGWWGRGWVRRIVCDPMCSCLSLHFVAGLCLTCLRCVDCLPPQVHRVFERLACIVWNQIMLVWVCHCAVLVRSLASFINFHCS